MSYPPYCVLCGQKANWNSDFNSEDYGFDVDGIVGVYTCCSCQTTNYIIDIFLEESQPRIIKYEIQQDDENNDCINIEQEISNCLLCSSNLNLLSCKPIETNDILINDSPIEPCIETIYECNECKQKYTVIDITTECDLYHDDDFPIFYSRSIYLSTEED